MEMKKEERATVEVVEQGAAEQGAEKLGLTLRHAKKLRSAVKAGPFTRPSWNQA